MSLEKVGVSAASAGAANASSPPSVIAWKRPDVISPPGGTARNRRIYTNLAGIALRSLRDPEKTPVPFPQRRNRFVSSAEKEQVRFRRKGTCRRSLVGLG